MGCWRRKNCAARMDQELSTALILMGEPQKPLKICKRCGAELVEWRIVGGSTRLWECVTMVPDDYGHKFRCGWTLSEVPFHLDKSG